MSNKVKYYSFERYYDGDNDDLHDAYLECLQWQHDSKICFAVADTLYCELHISIEDMPYSEGLLKKLGAARLMVWTLNAAYQQLLFTVPFNNGSDIASYFDTIKNVSDIRVIETFEGQDAF